MAQSLNRAESLPVALWPRWRAWHALLTLASVGLVALGLAGLGEGASGLAAAAAVWGRADLLGLFFVTYTAAFGLRALAWRVLLPNGPGAARLFNMLQVALLANHLFPTKVGEVVRMGLLARAGVPLGAAAASTALARLLDFATLCAIALALGPLAGEGLEHVVGRLALPISTIGLSMAGFALLASGRLTPLLARLPGRFGRVADQARKAVVALPPHRGLAALTLVVPSWLLEAGALWTVAHAAGVPLSVEVAAAATAFAVAFQAFQVTPGGLGLYEASLTGALALCGVEPSTGLGLAVATHALKFGYSYAVGFPCAVAEGVFSAGSSGRRSADGGPPGSRERGDGSIC